MCETGLKIRDGGLWADIGGSAHVTVHHGRDYRVCCGESVDCFRAVPLVGPHKAFGACLALAIPLRGVASRHCINLLGGLPF